MSRAFQPYTSLEQLERLFEQEDRARANTTAVKVDRAALKNVLMDHARLIEMRGYTVEEPDE